MLDTVKSDPVYIVSKSYVSPDDIYDETQLTTCLDSRELVNDRSFLKFMSKQDKLGTACAIETVKQAGLAPEELKTKTGIYLTVGRLAFEEPYFNMLYKRSRVDDKFSMEKFAADAFRATRPLLTFKCLPNMPIFHISYNLGIHGQYFITYPGPGQWFQVLDRAIKDLQKGVVDHALVGSVFDGQNLLVRQYTEKTAPEDVDKLIDCASFWVLSKTKTPQALARISDLRVSYKHHDPFTEPKAHTSSHALPVTAGPVEPSLALSLALENGLSGPMNYNLCSRDFITGSLQLEAL